MSKLKSKNIFIILFLIFVSFFAFGCKEENPVQNIYFNFEESEEQIVLLAGQTFDISDYVVVEPSYASDKSYKLVSNDESIVKIQDKNIIAVREGSAYVKIVSNDNGNKQDVILITVEDAVTKLAAPTNLVYNSTTQTFGFTAVNNASSYIIKVNKTEINMGNSTTFALKDYSSAYDNVLNVSVKAVSPKYSFAFTNSDYCEEVSVYQSSGVNNVKMQDGVLTYNKLNSENLVDIYIDNILFKETVSAESLDDFKSLDVGYAGKRIKVKLVANAKDDVVKNLNKNVVYCESSTNIIEVDVLDEPLVTMNSNVLSWNYVSGVEKYDLYINGSKLTSTTENFYSLQTNAADFESSTTDYELKVKSVLPYGAVNTAITTKEQIVKFNRLQTPELELNEDGLLVWDEVTNAEVYEVLIYKESTLIESFVVDALSISLSKYESGFNYRVKVKAVGAVIGEVNYLSSFEKEKIVEKKSKPTLSISDYVLTINAEEGDECLVEFGINEANSEGEKRYSKTLTASEDGIKLLMVNDGRVGNFTDVVTKDNYSAGLHTIKVKNLGNNSESINGEEVTIDFEQLRKLNTGEYRISNAVISVDRGSGNENAIFKFVTTGGTIASTIDEEGVTSIQFNTVKEGTSNFIGAGLYETKIYVLGNGGAAGGELTTFSYKESSQDAVCGIVDFSVLEAPTGFLPSSNETKILFNKADAVEEYKTYERTDRDADPEELSTTISDYDISYKQFGFELKSGTKVFNIQSIGNGINKLDSKLSEDIVVNRLNSDELKFDNSTNVISRQINNEIGYFAGYELKCNGKDIDYDFSTGYIFNDAISEYVFSLVVKATNKIGSEYYLNSLPYVLTLKRIDATSNCEIVDNKLIIKQTKPNNEELGIKVEFKFADLSTVTFVSDETYTKLVYSSYELNYDCEYVDDGGFYEYVVDLLDENHQLPIDKMESGFNVRVSYYQPHNAEEGDALIESFWSGYSGDLVIQQIDEKSDIYVKANKDVIVKPKSENNIGQYFIGLKFINLTSVTEYVFNSNMAKTELVCGTCKLDYSYESEEYTISADSIISQLGEKYSLAVMYSENGNGVVGDTDSAYSQPIEVNKMAAPEISYEYDNIIVSLDMVAQSLIKNKGAKITLRVSAKNASSDEVRFDINLKEVGTDAELDDGKIKIAANKLLAYNIYNNEVMVTEISANYIIDYTGANSQYMYYTNSNVATKQAYTLLTATNIKTAEDARMLTWSDNENNKISGNAVSVGYVVEIDYNGTKYYTNDTKLKYLNNGSYTSFENIITDTKKIIEIIFPYGYDENGKDFAEGGTVFGPGVYKVRIKTYCINQNVSYITACSNFSSEITFTVLGTASMKVEEGKLVWDSLTSATGYIVKAYDTAGTKIFDAKTTKTSYTFNDSDDAKNESGVIAVTVTAISNAENVVNGAESEILYIYRLPNNSLNEEVYVDDGKLILKAGLFFTKAVIEFVGLETKVEYENPNYAGEMTSIGGLGGWQYVDKDNDYKKKLTALYRYEIPRNKIPDLYDMSYDITIKFYGNTTEKDDNTLEKFGVIDSVENSGKIKLQKLKSEASDVIVESGKITFNHASSLQHNYWFNGGQALTSENFWLNTFIYRIQITTPGGVNYIYAVDYYKFKKAKDEPTEGFKFDSADEYTLETGMENLCASVKYKYGAGDDEFITFNVFKDNTINFKESSNIYFYPVNVYNNLNTEGTNTYTYTGSATKTKIDLNDYSRYSVSVTVLSGDSYFQTDDTGVGYLEANVVKEKPFVRYKNTELFTDSGLLTFADLTARDESGNLVDYPIYKLSVSPANAEAGTEPQVKYLYYGITEEDALEVVIRFEKNDSITARSLILLKDPISNKFKLDFNDIVDYEYSVYNCSLQTLAGKGVGTYNYSDYLMNAVEPEVKELKQYQNKDNLATEDEATIKVTDDGLLRIVLSYYTKEGVKNYCYNYEVTITYGGKKYVYDICYNTITKQGSDGITLYDENFQKAGENEQNRECFKYHLPKEITLNNKEKLTIEGNTTYSIQVRALGNSSGILHGEYSDTCEFTTAQTVQMPDGKSSHVLGGELIWKVDSISEDPANPVYPEVTIKVVNNTNNMVIYIKNVKGIICKGGPGGAAYQYHSYAFSDDAYFSLGNYMQIAEDSTYSIYISVEGAGGVVNSPFELVVESMQRLPQVQTTTIKMYKDDSKGELNGNLTWGYDTTTYSNAKFKVEITKGSGSEEVFVDSVETSSTSLNILEEFSSLEVGEYNVYITVLGDNFYTTSIKSEKVAGFIKAGAVSDISFKGRTVEWEAGENAEKYYVVINKEDGTKIGGFIVSETKCLVPDSVEGKFSVTVYSLGADENKSFFSDPVKRITEVAVPKPVNNVKCEGFTLFWQVDLDFNTGVNAGKDKLSITYTIERIDAGDGYTTKESSKDVTINPYSNYDTATKRYFYELTEVGTYKNIKICVIREGTMSSAYVEYSDEYTFNLYKAGSGTEENPYLIATAEQLLNVEKLAMANKYFVITQNISMSSVYVAERLSSYSAIIANEFNGTLNGNGKSISSYNLKDGEDTINLTTETNFALFNKLTNATIINLTLGQANVTTNIIRQANVITNIKKSFANTEANVVKLSMLAVTSKNSTIDNVDLYSTKVTLTGGELDGGFMLAGLVCEATGGTIKNCEVDFTADIQVDFAGDTYVSSVVAKADKGTALDGLTIKFDLNVKDFTDAPSILSNVGGAVAYLQDGKINNAQVQILYNNIYALNVGGIVGSMKEALITDSKSTGFESTGSESTGDIIYKRSSAINLGGVAGYVENSTISASGSSVVFDVEFKTTSVYVGAVAGNLYATNGKTTLVDSCYRVKYEGDETSTIGLYGYKNGQGTITTTNNREYTEE